MFNSRRRYVVLWYLIHRVKLQMCDQSIVLSYLKVIRCLSHRVKLQKHDQSINRRYKKHYLFGQYFPVLMESQRFCTRRLVRLVIGHALRKA